MGLKAFGKVDLALNTRDSHNLRKTNTMSNKAYNFVATPVGEIDTTPSASGKPKLRFRATVNIRGREVTRTVVAQGAAAEKLNGKVETGVAVGIRALIDHAPANDGAARGGEYLTVVDLPRAKAA